jgi:cell division protein FtsQ
MPRVKQAPPPPPRLLLQDRPGRWKLLWRRQKKMMRPALAGSVLVAALLIAMGLVHLLGRGTSFAERMGNTTAALGLRVDNVVITGRQKTPEGLVRAALGVHPGDPIFAFSVNDARTRLETINWVKSAIVERQLPGTILVQLTERSPFAVWQHDGKFALVDRDGNMVTDSNVAAFADQLPLVVGAGAPQAAAALLDALATQPDLQSRMVAAVRVGERRWNLRMKNGADVLLPEGAEVKALAKLAELQNTHDLLDRPLQTIDLRLPDRLVIRPLAEKITDKSTDKPTDAVRNAANPGRKPT